jgi:hypothetical protein
MGIFAEATHEVGRGVHFGAVFSPQVGRLSLKVGIVNLLRVSREWH